jgi:hypothetical protein
VLYDLLTNKLERVELKLSQDAYKKYKKKKIAKLTSSYSEENYDMLFHQILEILKTIEDHYKWQINNLNNINYKSFLYRFILQQIINIFDKVFIFGFFIKII